MPSFRRQGKRRRVCLAFVTAPRREDAERLGDVVKFHWEAVAKDGEAFGGGLNVRVLAADGRIERDYTFVER